MQDNASLEIRVRFRPQSLRWTRRIVVYAVFASFAASLDPAKEAGAIESSLPIDCTPGQDCVVQNYVDQDPGPGWQDYRCGSPFTTVTTAPTLGFAILWSCAAACRSWQPRKAP